MIWKTLKHLLLIRRIEFFVVEVTIFTIPLFGTVRARGDLLGATVIEGAILFFVLYSLGDMINCLSDRDLDQTYKTRLSDAVHGLGVKTVYVIVVAEVVLALALGLHLSWASGKWSLLALVLVGMFLGIEYSVGPVHFKSRGVGHLACLWLLLYFLPMLYASLLVRDELGWPAVLLAGSYATVEMGIILVNTSEDYPEDLAMGVRTTTVALGLRRTLWLALTMVLAGGASFLATWGWLLGGPVPPGWGARLALAGLALAWAYPLSGLWRLAREVAAADEPQKAIQAVKRRGKLVPVWATVVGWAGVLCGVARLLAAE